MGAIVEAEIERELCTRLKEVTITSKIKNKRVLTRSRIVTRAQVLKLKEQAKEKLNKMDKKGKSKAPPLPSTPRQQLRYQKLTKGISQQSSMSPISIDSDSDS